MPNHCSTSQTSLHCLLGNQHRESVKKSCEGMWLDDAAKLWTTGVNVGSQVKKRQEEVLLSFVSVSRDYSDVMFTPTPKSQYSIVFSAKHYIFSC